MVDVSTKCAYSTLEFAKLRNFSKGEFHIDDLETKRARIAELRANVATILNENSEENRTAFVHHGFDLWNEFADAPPPFRLPRQYVSKDLLNLFQILLRKLFALEACQLYPEGGNVVLHGVKGVGKTTVLQVAGVVAACLLNNVLPVYWIFEKTGDLSDISPKQLTHATRLLFNTSDLDSIISFDSFVTDTMSAAESRLERTVNCRKVLFLFDEFTNLYPANASTVYQFRDIAREGGALFVLAASKFNVRNERGSSDPKDSRFERVLSNIVPGKTFTEEEAKRIFSFTGGVGRHIVNYIIKGDIPRPCAMPDLHMYPQLWNIACRLLTTTIHSSSIALYASIHDVDHWIDNLILYNDGSHLSFLFPFLLEEFRSFVYLEANKVFYQAHIFQVQRRGLNGGSSGHSNEDFLCRYMPTLFGLASHDRSIHMRLSSAASLSIRHFSDTAGNFTDVDNPEEFFAAYHKTLVKWSVRGTETGIDRIWFKWDGDKKVLTLTGIQVKTGCDRSVMTSGILATQRKKKRASDCDDACVAGILSMAERGFAALIPALKTFAQESIPLLTIDIDALHICTNKQAADGFKSFFAKQEDCEFHIDDTLRATYDLPASFECILHDGPDWIENELLPRDVSLFVKNP